METIETNRLSELMAELVRAGYRIIAPVRDGETVRLMEWRHGAAVEIGQVPVNSIKDFLLPRSQVIGRTAIEGNQFTVQDVQPQMPPTVLLAVRPCDAAGLAAMDAALGGDTADPFYVAARAAMTVVPLICTSADAQCFCTSLGGSPDGTCGADAVLRPADGGKRLILEPLTDKGHAVAQKARSATVRVDVRPDAPVAVPVRFDADAVRRWSDGNYDSERWLPWSLPCLGCGACAYACPTCHCFDIQDEGTRHTSVRLRNWDACGLGLFTLHASGHNPRPTQAARWRQRVLHKFSYFPQRFGMIACTGCGRCARVCANGMAIAEVCEAIEELKDTSAP